ncbi:hypothetical protein F5I97DRAFT_2059987, partial [Phlebopus sp. FC_14]
MAERNSCADELVTATDDYQPPFRRQLQVHRRENMAIFLIELLSRMEEYVPQLCAAVLQPIDLDTPYSRYVTVNFVARPEDHEPIDTIVTERQSQITDLTQGIERVETLCQKLKDVKRKLEEHKFHVEKSQTFHRVLTSAIRRLPPEIFGEIFRQWLPKDTCVVPGSMRSPLVLTQVCQRWRSIAMAIPQLWSSLTIDLEKWTRDTVANVTPGWRGLKAFLWCLPYTVLRVNLTVSWVGCAPWLLAAAICGGIVLFSWTTYLLAAPLRCSRS